MLRHIQGSHGIQVTLYVTAQSLEIETPKLEESDEVVLAPRPQSSSFVSASNT